MNSNFDLDYIQLLKTNYGNLPIFKSFENNVKKSIEFCQNNPNINLTNYPIYNGSQEMLANISLIQNTEIKNTAFFGYFDCHNDQKVFNGIWENLKVKCKEKGINKLIGPINGTIWHLYRTISYSDGTKYFKGELICKDYYYDLLKSQNPAHEIKFHSGYRENLDIILDAAKESYENLDKKGFNLKEYTQITPDFFMQVYNVVINVFAASDGFVKLSPVEFASLYTDDKLSSDLFKLYCVFKNEVLAGFLYSVKESDAEISAKTICVLNEFQGLGLGNALAYKLHLDAKSLNIKRVIYPLVRESNKIQNFPKQEKVIFRKYSLFEYNI